MTTPSTPHYEIWSTWCFSHWVPPNGFNNARQYITSANQYAGHLRQTKYWGNTQSRPQCTETWVASNGLVEYIFLPYSH